MNDILFMGIIMGFSVGAYSALNMHMLTKHKHLDKDSKGRKFFNVLSNLSFFIALISMVCKCVLMVAG